MAGGQGKADAARPERDVAAGYCVSRASVRNDFNIDFATGSAGNLSKIAW
jgi:hypothetical protein